MSNRYARRQVFIKRARAKKDPPVSPIEIEKARATLLMFPPEQPLIVPQVIYNRLAACPELEDVLDRMRAAQRVPPVQLAPRKGVNE